MWLVQICRQKTEGSPQSWYTVCEPNEACIEATAKCKALIEEEDRRTDNALKDAIERTSFSLLSAKAHMVPTAAGNGFTLKQQPALRKTSLKVSFKKAQTKAPENAPTTDMRQCKHPWLEDPGLRLRDVLILVVCHGPHNDEEGLLWFGFRKLGLQLPCRGKFLLPCVHLAAEYMTH